MASSPAGRLAFPDALRALASQLIVWHHLAFYGPLSDLAMPLAPRVMEWLYDYGRMAVQVFFVVGGYTLARGLERRAPGRWRDLAALAWRRYRHIGLPYLAAVALAIVANAIAAGWMTHDSISAPPTLPQLLAHALFLQDLLGFEALTAGIWYLAVDWQIHLGVLLVFLLAGALARRLRPGSPGAGLALAQAALGALALASLAFFNRRPALDVWGLYFFASVYLGMAAHWALAGRLPRAVLPLAIAAVGLAGALDHRPRLVVAAATAAALALAGRAGWLDRPRSRVVAWLGRSSYALFLTHFPTCLVVNAALTRAGVSSPAGAMWGMVGAWAASMVVAALFHRQVETRLQGRPASAGRAGAAAA